LDQSSGRLIFKDKRQLEATNFAQGIAQGLGKLTFHSHHNHASNDSFLAGNFKNGGCLNGLVRGYEYLPQEGIENDPSFDEPVLNLVAFYKNGFLATGGPIWKIILSPDGIVLGYFYIESDQIRSDKANMDIDFT
jgi:hypothetical protein